MWFLAGGLTALALARRLARWWRRLFWVACTAAFALGAVFLLAPSSGPDWAVKAAQRASTAAWRMVSELGGSW